MLAKKIGKIFCLFLMLTLLISACGQSGTTTPTTSTTPPSSSGDGAPASAPAQETFKIYLAGATPGGGGVWDMIGAGMAEAIIRSNKGSSVTVVPGGGVSDVPVVSDKEAELGLTHSVIAVAGVKGEDPFTQAYTNIRGVASFYGSPLQFAVSPKLGLTSIGDIKENKVPIKLAVGDPGSTGELATKRILEAYGMTYGDIESWGGQILFKDMGEAATMYGDDIINGFTLLTLAPNGPLQQVSSNKEVQLLPIDQDKVRQMVDNYGYSAASIPQDAYAFMTGDLTSFSSQVVLITSDDRSEQEVYQITKAFLENIDYLRSIHNNLKDLQPSDMVDTGIELHPGAAKAYKEAGIL